MSTYKVYIVEMNQLKAIDAFSKNVKFLRTKKGLTLDEMGTLLGVTRQRVWSIENGKTWTSIETLQKLSKLFKIQETDLFDPDLESKLK